MANRLTKEKAKTIANCFALNGFENRVKTLIDVGYKTSYARCGLSSKIYDNMLVKAEIKALQDAQSVKTGFSLDDAQRMYEEDRAFAKTINQAGPMVSATTGICRLYGFDKDNQVGEKTVILISPKSLPVKTLPKQIESEVKDV